MNKSEILDLIRTLGDQAFPQLVMYAKINLFGNLVFLAFLFALHGAAWIVWRKLEKGKYQVQPEDEMLCWGFIALTGIACFFVGFSVICQALRIHYTPELEAIRLIVGK